MVAKNEILLSMYHSTRLRGVVEPGLVTLADVPDCTFHSKRCQPSPNATDVQPCDALSEAMSGGRRRHQIPAERTKASLRLPSEACFRPQLAASVPSP